MIFHYWGRFESTLEDHWGMFFYILLVRIADRIALGPGVNLEAWNPGNQLSDHLLDTWC